jgi:hypothetical protein
MGPFVSKRVRKTETRIYDIRRLVISNLGVGINLCTLEMFF